MSDDGQGFDCYQSGPSTDNRSKAHAAQGRGINAEHSGYGYTDDCAREHQTQSPEIQSHITSPCMGGLLESGRILLDALMLCNFYDSKSSPEFDEF